MRKSSTKKIYITFCSTGELNNLKKLINSDPGLLMTTNSESNQDGLYYAIRNLKESTIDFLLQNGLRIDPKMIHRTIIQNWRGSLESYIFLKKYGEKILKKPKEGYTFIPGEYKFDGSYDKWLFDTYTNYCFNNHNITKLCKILKHENLLTTSKLQEMLDRYTRYQVNKSNKNYIANIRELQLMILL